jgi:Family of unknown function (DUF6390)
MTARGSVAVGPPPARVRSGALMFTRYAYPPNALGYCGPAVSGQLLEQVTAGVDDADLRHLLRGFEGAWPYLELIAAAAHLPDPLDARVVEAYWVGNDLLGLVPMADLGTSFEERFRPRVGRAAWTGLAETIPAGAVAHHSTHVLLVYPWVGLLRAGRVAEPMRVLDGCRIRWGRVQAVHGGTAVVRSQPLVWDGRTLRLGPPRPEQVRVRADRGSLVPDLGPGDACALHWDWVCDRLDSRQLAALQRWTAHSLRLANAAAHPAPAAVLG